MKLKKNAIVQIFIPAKGWEQENHLNWQSEEVVSVGVGFEGKEFLEKNLPSCRVQSYEEYTTFFYRQGLGKYPSMQKLFEIGYHILFPGNLFRYVAIKGDVR